MGLQDAWRSSLLKRKVKECKFFEYLIQLTANLTLEELLECTIITLFSLAS